MRRASSESELGSDEEDRLLSEMYHTFSEGSCVLWLNASIFTALADPAPSRKVATITVTPSSASEDVLAHTTPSSAAATSSSRSGTEQKSKKKEKSSLRKRRSVHGLDDVDDDDDDDDPDSRYSIKRKRDGRESDSDNEDGGAKGKNSHAAPIFQLTYDDNEFESNSEPDSSSLGTDSGLMNTA